MVFVRIIRVHFSLNPLYDLTYTSTITVFDILIFFLRGRHAPLKLLNAGNVGVSDCLLLSRPTCYFGQPHRKINCPPRESLSRPDVPVHRHFHRSVKNFDSAAPRARTSTKIGKNRRLSSSTITTIQRWWKPFGCERIYVESGLAISYLFRGRVSTHNGRRREGTDCRKSRFCDCFDLTYSEDGTAVVAAPTNFKDEVCGGPQLLSSFVCVSSLLFAIVTLLAVFFCPSDTTNTNNKIGNIIFQQFLLGRRPGN
jgi:hypothetical protein